MILSVVPAARNSKPWSWEAASRNARNAKVKTCRSRCLFLPIGAGVNPLRRAAREVVPVVQAVQVPTAVHATDQELPNPAVSLESQKATINPKGFVT